MSSFNKLHSANIIYIPGIMARTIMIFEVVSNFILFWPDYTTSIVSVLSSIIKIFTNRRVIQ